MGFKRWQRLHRLVYFAATAGVIHYLWLVKSDIHVPLEYAAVMAVLLGWRIYHHYARPPRRVPAAVPARKEAASVPE